MAMITRIATTSYTSMIFLETRITAISMPDCPGVSSSSLLISHCRNRYLILDVLGQGTFGQVVKCQNLKTQEVVAVKVVKNRTAYFNQSMMEVSVLDLVWHSRLRILKRLLTLRTAQWQT